MKKGKQMTLLLLCFLCFFASFYTRAEPADVETTEGRLAKAKELQLTDWVDEEGFLVDAFFDGKSDGQISNMGLDGLIRTLSAEELEAKVELLKAGISAFTVTYYEKLSQKNPDTGNYLYTGFYEVDGVLAFCIERSMAAPAKGSPTGTPKEVTNNKLRKVLYYGYNGPKDKGYTHVETALAAAESNGDGDNSLGRSVLAEIVEYAVPPESFHVWRVETNGGDTQDLAYYTITPDGTLQVKKMSGDLTVTKNNPNYTLKGAVYKVYAEKACETLLKTLTTNASGLTGEASLQPGTYYVKETKTPTGYLLDSTVHKAVVKSSTLTKLEVEDEPELVVPKKLIQKVDAETGKASPQGSGSFADAEFTVRFYKKLYDAGVDPATLGVDADAEWKFRSNESGMMRFGVNFFLEGDSLRENASGYGRVPLGTLTIRETKAPSGYRINPTVVVKQMTEAVSGIGAYTLEEPVIKATLQKYKEGTQEPLEGAVFEHENPEGEVEQLTTDATGCICLKGLQKGTHVVREVVAPEGYEINGNEIAFTVNAKGKFQIISETDVEKGLVTTEIQEDENLLITVEDPVKPETPTRKLPETGNMAVAISMMIGLSCTMAAMIKKERRRKI